MDVSFCMPRVRMQCHTNHTSPDSGVKTCTPSPCKGFYTGTCQTPCQPPLPRHCVHCGGLQWAPDNHLFASWHCLDPSSSSFGCSCAAFWSMDPSTWSGGPVGRWCLAVWLVGPSRPSGAAVGSLRSGIPPQRPGCLPPGPQTSESHGNGIFGISASRGCRTVIICHVLEGRRN